MLGLWGHVVRMQLRPVSYIFHCKIHKIHKIYMLQNIFRCNTLYNFDTKTTTFHGIVIRYCNLKGYVAVDWMCG